jgi:NTP pyrophosphatase (non-canonical NTP hydrolase)
MEIKHYQKQVDEWIHTTGVRYFNELTNMAILTEEVGEFARLMARIHGEQSFKLPVSDSEAKEKLADEMADIFWVLTCLANQMEIDIESALKKNIQKKTLRDKDRHKNNDKLKD